MAAVLIISSLACRTVQVITSGEAAEDLVKTANAASALPTLTPPTVPTASDEQPTNDLLPPVPTLSEQQPTDGLLPTEVPPNPGLFILDDFSDRNSGWPTDYAEPWVMDYYQGGYHISITQPETVASTILSVDFADVRVLVDARLIGGEEDNYLGVLCRYQNGDNYYASVISSDGFYAILRRVQGTAPEVISDDYFLESIVINQHSELNLIEVSCVGDQIKLNVNGQTIAEVSDTAIPSGDVGLIVGTFSAESTDILFDNFTFYLEE
jgi:hypothetical protein